jgi:deoxyadenosine/deoxycytidine kinase
MRRIVQRGHHYESGINLQYLSQLNELYDDWVSGFNLCPVMTISTDNYDFVNSVSHFEEVKKMILDNLLE